MREALIAAGIAVLMVALSLVKVVVGVTPELELGIVVTGVGLVIGVAGGIAYHVRLAQVLGPRGQLDPQWLWHPTRLHEHLETKAERRKVFVWFGVGGFGWLLTVGGCGLIALSVFGIL